MKRSKKDETNEKLLVLKITVDSLERTLTQAIELAKEMEMHLLQEYELEKLLKEHEASRS